jgi:hypothetical protein
MNNLLLSIPELSDNFVSVLSSSLGVWYLIITNAIGVFAILCKVFEYQVAKRSTMFVFATIANICWVLYFLLFGNFASSLTCVINVVKMFIFMKRDNCQWANSIFWLFFFLLLQALVAVFTVKSYLDIFSVTAGFLGIFAYYVINQKHYRLLSFFHMAVWVANSIVNFYLIALISDVMSTTSCAVAIYRYDLSKNARKLKKEEKEQNKTQNNIEN